MTSKTTLACVLLAGLPLLARAQAPAQVKTWELWLANPHYTLYSDPYNGNTVKVGGFSGLFPAPGKKNSFYVVTDRGAAPDFISGSITYKCFATPDFGPHLLTVRLLPNGMALLDDIKPFRRPDGSIISGLPTSLPRTDIPYDLNLNQLPFDEDSIDAEGVTMDPWGNLWVCDEYKPSVAMLDASGTVRLRLVPDGTLTGAEKVPTDACLPGVLSKRRNNRGFEGIAATADGMLYAIVQRPLNNPNRAAADANGNVRIVAINLHTLLHGGTAPLIRQYIYRIPTTPNNVTLSDLFPRPDGRLLVSERVTDAIMLADLSAATDITPLENAAGRLIADPTKTIEQLNTAGLVTFGIQPVAKTTVVANLTAIDPLLEKIEGVSLVGNDLMVAYDNDFNVADTGSAPSNPLPGGPLVQLELVGENYPKIYRIPLP